jgi:site-specific DNA-methyltransferase (adenine-specific)
MPIDVIITGDCLDITATLPAGTADLVFTDPPFNIGLDYPGYHDAGPLAEHLARLEERLRAARRVLAPDGSLVIAMCPCYQPRVWVLCEDLGFHWRNTIVWHYTFGQSQKRKWTPSHTMLGYFVRDPKRFTFHPAKVQSARQREGEKRAQPGGKTPDDVWLLWPQEGEPLGFFGPAGDVWHVRRENGTFKGRVDHPCQMPLPVAERVIAALTDPGGLVVDPYAGTGTTLLAAQRLGRRFVGIELWPGTADLARRELAQAQTLFP